MGLASFGRAYAFFSAIISTFIGIILIIFGIAIWNTPNKDQHNNRPSALLLILFGVLIIIVSWFWVWLGNRSKTVADLEGVEGIYKIYKIYENI